MDAEEGVPHRVELLRRARKRMGWCRFTDVTTMRSPPRAVLVIAMFLLAEACASQPGSGAVHGRRAVAVACLISGDELRSTSATSLYEALVWIRPTMLRPGLYGELPTVVLDGMATADAAATLRALQVMEVRLVRRLSPAAARNRYGAIAKSGSILEVVTRRSSTDGPSESDSDCR